MKKRKKRKYTHIKPTNIPVRYQEGFLNRMCYNTIIYKNLKTSFNIVVSDLGGRDNLSRLEISLCERFVYIEMLLRNLETEGQNGDEDKFLDRYQRLTNSLNSIVSKLGISKRKTGDSELAKYLDEQNQE